MTSIYIVVGNISKRMSHVLVGVSPEQRVPVPRRGAARRARGRGQGALVRCARAGRRRRAALGPAAGRVLAALQQTLQGIMTGLLPMHRSCTLRTTQS